MRYGGAFGQLVFRNLETGLNISSIQVYRYLNKEIVLQAVKLLPKKKC